MQYWNAHYIDALHDTDIKILNTEEDYENDPLSFTLDDVTFRGTSLGDFQLAKEAQYTDAKEKFCLLKRGGYSTKYNKTFPYAYDLQRYELHVEIPMHALRKKDNFPVTGILFVSFKLTKHDTQKHHSIVLCDDTNVYPDDIDVSDFSLNVDGICCQSRRKTLYFEAALDDICSQIKNEYYLKCCFTCQYSDYSPYGCDDFGTMLCYQNHKDDYLKVNSKRDFFFYLEGKDCLTRQETYLCEQYSPRNRTGGYRGFVDGIPDQRSAVK